MTPGYITRAVRERVRAEAHDRCGYCLAPQSQAYDTLEIDHIIPEAMGGSDDRENLWLACVGHAIATKEPIRTLAIR